MRVQMPIALSLISLVLGACSNGGGGEGTAVPAPVAAPTPSPVPANSGQDTQGQFIYEYKYNGCTTGRRELTTKNAYCDALLDDSLNNNCAREMRVEVYNRLCAANQTISVGTLPPMSTARCVVNGMDLKDRTFLQNMNPFNPQRRQVYRDIFWGAQQEQGYDILGSMVTSYGRGRLILTPAREQVAARGEVFLTQLKGDNRFSVASHLGSQIRLKVTNYEIEKEVEAVCLSDKSFKRAKSDLRRVRCSLSHSESGRRKTQREEEITWDLVNSVERELFRGSSSERISLRLKPAKPAQDETIEVQAVDLDVDKTLTAEVTLNEGLEVRFQSRLTDSEMVLICAPASK